MAGENTKIYISQGGDAMTVASGATLTVAGTLTNSGTQTNSGTITNSGTETLSGTHNVTGTLHLKDGSVVKWEPQTETTAANMEETGFSLCNTTGAAKKVFTMDAPAAGAIKFIATSVVNSTANRPVIDAGSGVQWTATANQRYANLKTAGASIIAVALSATRWFVAASAGTITYTTTSTG